MVNDVDYTRISALALHDWSACAPVGPDRLPRLLVSEAVPADDTWGTRFLRTTPSRSAIPSAKPGDAGPAQNRPPSPRPFVPLACRSGLPPALDNVPPAREPDRDNTRRESQEA